MPLALTLAVFVPASLGTLRVPITIPSVVGLKATARKQEAPGDRGVLPTANGQVVADVIGKKNPTVERVAVEV